MPPKTSLEINRRDFAKAAGLGAAGIVLGNGLASLGQAAGRPNVLLVIADQWRQPRWFPEGAKLPGFDRLRREGLAFTNSFVSAVPCSPSRACLFTGRHLTQHGVQNNVNLNMNPSLDPRIPTLGHRFQEAGFRTPYFGKWHLTEPDEYRQSGLTAYGFEAWRRAGPRRQAAGRHRAPTPALPARPSIGSIATATSNPGPHLLDDQPPRHSVIIAASLSVPPGPQTGGRLPGQLLRRPRRQAPHPGRLPKGLRQSDADHPGPARAGLAPLPRLLLLFPAPGGRRAEPPARGARPAQAGG